MEKLPPGFAPVIGDTDTSIISIQQVIWVIGINPQTIQKAISEIGPGSANSDYAPIARIPDTDNMEDDPEALVEALREEMLMYSDSLEFEKAARIRDRIAMICSEAGISDRPARKRAHKKKGRRR